MALERTANLEEELTSTKEEVRTLNYAFCAGIYLNGHL